MRTLRGLLHYNMIWAIVKHHEVVPRFHGIAFEDFQRRRLVTLLFPLNHIVFAFLWLWQKIRHARKLSLDKDKNPCYTTKNGG